MCTVQQGVHRSAAILSLTHGHRFVKQQSNSFYRSNNAVFGPYRITFWPYIPVPVTIHLTSTVLRGPLAELDTPR